MRKHNSARSYGTGTHRRGSSAPFGEPLKLADRSEGSRYQALPALMMVNAQADAPNQTRNGRESGKTKLVFASGGPRCGSKPEISTGHHQKQCRKVTAQRACTPMKRQPKPDDQVPPVRMKAVGNNRDGFVGMV